MISLDTVADYLKTGSTAILSNLDPGTSNRYSWTRFLHICNQQPDTKECFMRGVIAECCYMAALK
jgi:hypothetical protein